MHNVGLDTIPVNYLKHSIMIDSINQHFQFGFFPVEDKQKILCIVHDDKEYLYSLF